MSNGRWTDEENELIVADYHARSTHSLLTGAPNARFRIVAQKRLMHHKIIIQRH